MTSSTSKSCHLTFGIIADVQYADVDDGTNYARTRRRYYRGALNHLKNTVTHWKQTYPDLAFVIQLGDLLDGWNKRGGGNKAAITALETVLKPLRSLSCPTYHMTGNHDFYNFTRKQFLGLKPSGYLPQTEENGYLPKAAATHSCGSSCKMAGCKGEGSCEASKGAGERSCDASSKTGDRMCTSLKQEEEGPFNSSQKPGETACRSSNDAREETCKSLKEEGERTCISKEATYIASELNSSALPGVSGIKGELYYSVIVHRQLRIIVLDTYDVSTLGFEDWPENPNFKMATAILEKENPKEEKNSCSWLKGKARRFVAYNGGLGKRQLKWLNAQLTEAEKMKQNVIICGHVQLVQLPGVYVCCVWNYQEVLDIVHSHKCVILCLAGHDHDGALIVDTEGIHHLVLNGVIETAPEGSAYATAFLRKDSLEIKGSGFVRNVTVHLKYPIESS